MNFLLLYFSILSVVFLRNISLHNHVIFFLVFFSSSFSLLSLPPPLLPFPVLFIYTLPPLSFSFHSSSSFLLTSCSPHFFCYPLFLSISSSFHSSSSFILLSTLPPHFFFFLLFILISSSFHSSSSFPTLPLHLFFFPFFLFSFILLTFIFRLFHLLTFLLLSSFS